MASGPQPPGEVGADAHSLIRLRERTENPQLTDVPSDLRVNGARHASHDSVPPSKPKSPPRERVSCCSFNCSRSEQFGLRAERAAEALAYGIDHGFGVNRFSQHRRELRLVEIADVGAADDDDG